MINSFTDERGLPIFFLKNADDLIFRKQNMHWNTDNSSLGNFDQVEMPDISGSHQDQSGLTPGL